MAKSKTTTKKDSSTPKRIYSASDVVMLMVLEIIIENAIDNQVELLAENDNWTQDFLDTQNKKIEAAYKDILGIDPKKNLRKATVFVNKTIDVTLRLLSTFTVNLEAAIIDDDRRLEILKVLGFSLFYRKAQKRSLPDFVSLLYQFKENMNVELITEVTFNNNIKEIFLKSIIDVADTLKNENIDRNALKTSTKKITESGVLQLNDLYKVNVKRFAKQVKNFYEKKGEKVKAEMFTFTKLKKTVDAPAKPKKSSSTTTPPPSSI